MKGEAALCSISRDKNGTSRRRFFRVSAGAAGIAAGVFGRRAVPAPNPPQANDDFVTAFNPLGQPPPLVLLPLAPRLDSIKGKTIYVVDTKFPASKPFFEEVVKILKDKYPDTTWIPRDKIGSYFDDDPKLWAEIKEKGHGMIILIGH